MLRREPRTLRFAVKLGCGLQAFRLDQCSDAETRNPSSLRLGTVVELKRELRALRLGNYNEAGMRASTLVSWYHSDIAMRASSSASWHYTSGYG